MDYIAMGRRIRQQRRAYKMTQSELAKKLGLSVSFLGHIERGSRKASVETLVTLANVLNISVDALLSESLTVSPPQPADAELKKKERLVLRQLVQSITENWDDWVRADGE